MPSWPDPTGRRRTRQGGAEATPADAQKACAHPREKLHPARRPGYNLALRAGPRGRPPARRSDGRRDRRRLRRHRHQPALHHAGGVRRARRSAARRGGGAGRALADLLGAAAGRHDQVRRGDHARRQPGRRRRARPGRAWSCAACAPAHVGSASRSCSRCSARRCSMATASSRRRSRCWARSRG